ncbi:DUF551 domain-containing protein [Klebsiella michiganensis]|nr:DUF551 domain-containing protein [Klebsiella michiganensis]MEC5776001.1 DUF551 domain-containing protein [Klebsiella michiganensis]
MTKSTITRERIQRIIRAINSEAYDEEEIRGWLSSDEIMELSRMALAAMDSSESVELPLDYLQGHKDGLEFASQLAEANHPETGDWLYDDPIELAKAIRKGPDMPPAQPAADSEPDRNPVLAYADSYRDMAKQGVESVPIWSVITDLERNIAPLYRHAQPVPVVPYDFDFDRFNDVVWLECVASNPHMHSPTTSIIARVALELNKRILAGNSPVIPDGWTCNDKANAALMMLDRIETVDPVDDDRVDGIKRIVRELAAATQSPGSDPATVPGKWIPVSEQMPDVGVKVLCFPAKDEPIHATFNGQLWLQDVSWSGSEEPIDNVIPVTVTHWMPLPAGPQGVKGE